MWEDSNHIWDRKIKANTRKNKYCSYVYLFYNLLCHIHNVSFLISNMCDYILSHCHQYIGTAIYARLEHVCGGAHRLLSHHYAQAMRISTRTLAWLRGVHKLWLNGQGCIPLSPRMLENRKKITYHHNTSGWPVLASN